MATDSTRRWNGSMFVTSILSALCAVTIYAWLTGPQTIAQAEPAPASDQPVIRTQRIEIVDRNGVKRVGISSTENGTGGISLYDKTGKVRGEFAVTDGEPRLALFDSAEHAQIAIVIGPTGKGSVVTGDANPAGAVAKGPATITANWQKLRIGMTGAEVEAILGKGEKQRRVTGAGVMETWDYPRSSVDFQDGKVWKWTEPPER